ncbi:hypothetical protein MCBRY_003004 [Methylocystis bryophila]
MSGSLSAGRGRARLSLRQPSLSKPPRLSTPCEREGGGLAVAATLATGVVQDPFVGSRVCPFSTFSLNRCEGLNRRDLRRPRDAPFPVGGSPSARLDLSRTKNVPNSCSFTLSSPRDSASAISSSAHLTRRAASRRDRLGKRFRMAVARSFRVTVRAPFSDVRDASREYGDADDDDFSTGILKVRCPKRSPGTFAPTAHGSPAEFSRRRRRSERRRGCAREARYRAGASAGGHIRGRARPGRRSRCSRVRRPAKGK